MSIFGAMSNNRTSMDNSFMAVKTSVYDVMEPDPAKKKLGTFHSITAAAKFAGVSNGTVAQCVKHKHRSYKNGLGKVLAFR